MLRRFTAVLLAGLLTLSASAAYAQSNLWGSINNRYGVTMELNFAGSELTGSYRYNTGKGALRLKGTINSAGDISLEEFAADGKQTGTFKGKLVPEKRITGNWCGTKDKSKPLPFILAFASTDNALELGKDGIVLVDHLHILPKHNPDYPERKEARVHLPSCGQSGAGLGNPEMGGNIDQLLSAKNIYGQSLSEMEADIKGGDVWLDLADYQIDYNNHYLLDGDYMLSGSGAYPSTTVRHLLISSRDGKKVTAALAFTKASLPKLAALVSKARKAEMDRWGKENRAHAEDFKDLFAQTINEDPLSSFSISDSGVTFLHDWAFPHACQALQPPGRYFFSFQELAQFIAPNGPLQVFLPGNSPPR